MKKVLFLLTLGVFLSADPIKIAIDNRYPPFEYPGNGNQIVGFDVDLAAELAKRVGFEYQLVYTDYDAACEAINSKKVDIGISGFGEDDATENCDKSVSYYETEYLFIKDKARNDINTIDDLAGKKVAYDQDSTTMRDFLKDLNAKPVVKRSGTFISTLLLLHENKVESVIVYSTSLPILRGRTEFLADNDKLKLDLIAGGLSNFVIFHEQPSDDSETFVIFPKDGSQDALKNQINNAIIQMRSDGTIKKLLQKYGLE